MRRGPRSWGQSLLQRSAPSPGPGWCPQSWGMSPACYCLQSVNTSCRLLQPCGSWSEGAGPPAKQRDGCQLPPSRGAALGKGQRWRGTGRELVGRYEKGRDSLLCHLCGCEVLPSPALCSFPAAVAKFCNYYCFHYYYSITSGCGR